MPRLLRLVWLVLVVFLHGAPLAAQTYEFTTIGGRATFYGADDGPAATASFAARALAIDGQGTIFLVSSGTNTIRKIAPDGLVSTLAGAPYERGNVDGIGTAARFNSPSGIAVDASGTLYVADTGNGTLRRITSDGRVTTLRNNTAGAYLAFPSAMMLDSSGHLLVVDNGALQKVSPDGDITMLLSN